MDNLQDYEKCSSCGIPFMQHQGLMRTCAKLLAAESEVARQRAFLHLVLDGLGECEDIHAVSRVEASLRSELDL